ncbi:glycerate kinase [Thermodesulfobacteriota bacterium]
MNSLKKGVLMRKGQYLNRLEEIFLAGVERVDPYRLIINHVSLDDARLKIHTEEYQQNVDLATYQKIYVVGAGKATAKMAKAFEDILGARITAGVISVKYGHTDNLKKIKIVEAGHPIPDDNGIRAAREIAALARQADEKTLVISLISGGGSALTPFPYECETGKKKIALSLKEKQETTKILLECGAIINEINCVRKHLSQIKGGRLAQMLYPATSYNFILSDVIGDNLDTIASGPTTFDNTTFQDTQEIVGKYDIKEKLPLKVQETFKLGLAGKIPETPKSGDVVFKRVHNILVGTNLISLKAARKKAESLGYKTVILSSQIIGEAKEVAKVLCGIAKDIKRYELLAKRPVCLIAGGETTVTLIGRGKGGRNQEIALSFLAEIEKNPADTEGIDFLSASTDGNDGPTDAAGAFASNEILESALKENLSVNEYLKNNDSYHFFDKIGYLLKTGPTNTNVCDIHIILIK